MALDGSSGRVAMAPMKNKQLGKQRSSCQTSQHRWGGINCTTVGCYEQDAVLPIDSTALILGSNKLSWAERAERPKRPDGGGAVAEVSRRRGPGPSIPSICSASSLESARATGGACGGCSVGSASSSRGRFLPQGSGALLAEASVWCRMEQDPPGFRGQPHENPPEC